jgi:predicted ATPase
VAEDVVKAAPGVHILATSREPLRAAGERVHRLAPLEAPSASAGLTAAEALTFPGVQLFVDRAAACVDGFELSDGDAPVVGDICRRLDGVPLAIELAAGRVDALGVRGLATHLDHRFQLLSAGRRTAMPRHQTLAAALDWSHDLLSAAERTLLRRLAVFAGDFSLEGVVALAPDLPSFEVVGCVAELVAKSLVVADHRGEVMRYRLLDTTRLYSLEKLQESGELEPTRRRHAEHFGTFFAPAEDECETRTKAEWLAIYGRHIDNARAALDWAFSDAGDPGLGVALTVAAVPLWVQLSLMVECRGRVERALASIREDTDEAARARMRLSAALGWALTFGVGRTRETGEAWATALALAERLGDTSYQLRALWGLWIDHLNEGAFRRALELAQRFADIAAGSSDLLDHMMSDRMLANSLHFLGDQSKAQHHIERMFGRHALSTHQRSVVRFQSDQHVRARYFHARILWLRGFADQARRAVEQNIVEAETLDHALTFGSVLGQGACPIALLTGDLEAAWRYADRLFDHSERHGLGLWQGWARCFKALVEAKRGNTGTGLQDLRAALDRAGQARFLPRYLLLLGEYALCLGEAGEVGSGLETVDGALERCERNEELWYVPELLRIKGELLVHVGDTAPAEEHFLRALDWSERQGALSWRLRSAVRLARLWRDLGRVTTAHEVLVGVRRGFSEGFDTQDLWTAGQFLAELG